MNTFGELEIGDRFRIVDTSNDYIYFKTEVFEDPYPTNDLVYNAYNSFTQMRTLLVDPLEVIKLSDIEQLQPIINFNPGEPPEGSVEVINEF